MSYWEPEVTDRPWKRLVPTSYVLNRKLGQEGQNIQWCADPKMGLRRGNPKSLVLGIPPHFSPSSSLFLPGKLKAGTNPERNKQRQRGCKASIQGQFLGANMALRRKQTEENIEKKKKKVKTQQSQLYLLKTAFSFGPKRRGIDSRCLLLN